MKIPFEDLLCSITSAAKDILGDALRGVYLHGSLAMGCFNPEKSDIDLLLVINREMTDAQKRRFMEIVVELNARAPKKGLELSVVKEEVCRHFVYPTPFELHFSPAHLAWWQGDPEDYVRRMNGTDPDLVRAIMETEMNSLEERHKKCSGFWDTLGAMGPAWGMIGTLVGLVNMLYNMDDVANLGPAMAVALITTLYGSLLANWICTPVSNKLKADNGEEVVLKEVMIEGLLSIQAGENPRVIEEKLKSFLAPKDRTISEEGAGGDE